MNAAEVARLDAYTNSLYAAIAAAYQCGLHSTGTERANWHAHMEVLRAQLSRAYAEAEAKLTA